MTLGQFSIAVGAAPKWIHNARAVLRLPPRYSEQLARRLALTRLIHEATGVPLPLSWDTAGRASQVEPEGWCVQGPAAAVSLQIDFVRFSTWFLLALSRARVGYAERKRGRPSKHRKSGLRAARAYGIDVDLLRASLDRSPAERLEKLDEDVAFLQSMRVVGK